MATQVLKLQNQTAHNRGAQTAQQCAQVLAHSKQNSELPTDDFEQWAQLVRSQMLASLQRRYKRSSD